MSVAVLKAAVSCLLLASALCAHPVDAQEVNAQPIDEYRSNTAIGLLTCRMSLKFAAAFAEADAERREKVDPKMGDWRGCIQKQRAETLALFKRASTATRKPAMRDALKNYQVVWAAMMEGIAPSSDERKIDYERRQAAADTKLNEAWAKVEIEQ